MAVVIAVYNLLQAGALHMPDYLLTTKLNVPARRPNLVSRARLVARLHDGLQNGRRLTLVSATAGYGKTTLVVDWLAEVDRAAAWLALDERDNDPVQFVTYLIAALQTLDPNLGDAARSLLQSPQLAAARSSCHCPDQRTRRPARAGRARPR